MGQILFVVLGMGCFLAMAFVVGFLFLLAFVAAFRPLSEGAKAVGLYVGLAGFLAGLYGAIWIEERRRIFDRCFRLLSKWFPKRVGR